MVNCLDCAVRDGCVIFQKFPFVVSKVFSGCSDFKDKRKKEEVEINGRGKR